MTTTEQDILNILDDEDPKLVALYLMQLKSEGGELPQTPVAVLVDFDMFKEVIADEGEDALTGALNDADVVFATEDHEGGVLLDEAIPYTQEVSGSFVCHYCNTRYQERKGFLAYAPPFGDPALTCEPCIQSHVLVVIPEVKDQRKGG